MVIVVVIVVTIIVTLIYKRVSFDGGSDAHN
jgi:hypothetical protein